MATTRADVTPNSQPVIGWGLSVVHSVKGKAYKHKETIPLLKLGLIGIVLAILMLTYVRYVNKASTHGYFFKVESQKLTTIKNDYNLVKLDVLEYQQKLRNQSDNFDAWSDPSALRKRLIIVEPTIAEEESDTTQETTTTGPGPSHNMEGSDQIPPKEPSISQ